MILITGGLGFIGSHIVIELIQKNYQVVIIDNLKNSKLNVLYKIKEIVKEKDFKLVYYCFDIKDEEQLNKVFLENKIDYVIHCAGLKAVGESVKNPLLYYHENINITLSLLKIMEKNNCYHLVFSSSATVYGNQSVPMNEKQSIGQGITNPYGQTKFFIEQILMDLVKSNPKWYITSLRYFNPIGAHPSGLIGEDPNDIPNNLMPYLLKVANGTFPHLNIYGNDYNTFDGTGERDYIHVMDLAHAHYKAIVFQNKGYQFYNIGTGKSTSVLTLINSFQQINNININYQITNRRDGDLPIVYCDTNKAEKCICFKAKYDINQMVKDSWNFIKNN